MASIVWMSPICGRSIVKGFAISVFWGRGGCASVEIRVVCNCGWLSY